jgi:hypothetical protein
MPYKKIQIRPGVNRENTRYTTEGGWYESDKIRFRQGSPEKIGGWERISTYTFLGVCRSLWNWVTLGGQNIVSVGTEIKYYIERGGFYYDVTPLRDTTAAGDVTFAAVDGDATLTVTDTAHGATAGSYVTFSGATSLGGNIIADVLNQEYEIATIVDDDNYTIEAKDTSGATVTANSSDTGNGGASVVGAYQINIGSDVNLPLIGWGGGGYGLGTWGFGATSTMSMRLWSQSNFGEDLLFAYRGGGLYYWDATNGVTTRAVDATTLSGASDVPTVVNYTTVSDIYRFVFAFGANEAGSAPIDPMLVRWSDQEDAANWTPAATNQAGSLRLSHGSEIVTAAQARQEILVWTDSALYGFQYLGAPEVWGSQLLGDNISIASPNATAYVSNAAFWMGRGKFYMYDGTVKPLICNVRKFVFNDFNDAQYAQVTCWYVMKSSTKSGGSTHLRALTTIDKYVVYNYVENIWYYGTMARTAWLDSRAKRQSD